MGASSQHPQFDFYLPRWNLTTDVVNTTVEQYLRVIDPSDIVRSEQYKTNSILTNFTARTKQGLIGAVYRLDPEVELGTTVEYLTEDATGSSLTLNQLSKAIVGDVLETGRVGLLVDFPQTEIDMPTQAQVDESNNKARITKYEARSIINWKTENIGGVTRLELVVLKEVSSRLAEDRFSWIEVIQYRALRMIEGVYVQELYDDTDRLIETIIPTKADNSTWTEIPFVFIGSENNDPVVDNSPLYDLATVNIQHYRNSADYEESVYLVGQPTLVLNVGEVSIEDWKVANPDGAIMGSRNGILTAIGGSATLLQANPNQLADEAMKRKEQQAVMLGARLITPNNGVETAEAARIRHGSENSVLSNIVHNVSTGLLDAINFVGEFMGTSEEEQVFELNDMFFDDTIAPEMIIAAIQMLDRGIIAKADLRNQLRTVGVIEPDRTDEDIDGEAETVDPID